MVNEKMLALSKSHTPLALSDALPFSCQGCGHLCCGNLSTPIHVMPPEYIRIQWYLQRNPAARDTFSGNPFIYDLEHISGLPYLKLNFDSFSYQGQLICACSFLYASTIDAESVLMCAIHPARPHTCRIFPIGMVTDGWYGNKPLQTSYHIMSYCPGFEIPDPDMKIIAGYLPPSEKQTVQNWLEQQMDSILHEEMLFYFFEVITYYHHRGWHLPTYEHPHQAKLDEASYNELAGVFYEIPPLPENPADDHTVIMQHLKHFRDDAETIVNDAIHRSKLSFF